MVLVRGAPWRRVIGTIAVVLASKASAVPLSEVAPGAVGEPLRQSFIEGDTSHVRTREGFSCVTSRSIDITASVYTAPETDAPVPFDQIIRSHAASAQFVAVVPDGVESFRVQLKYSPRPETPIFLDLADGPVNVAAMLEPSGDSIRITDAAMLRAIRTRLEAGEAIELTATSRDTGRTVTDRIEGMDFAVYDACRAGTPEPPVEPPSNRIAFDFEATQDPARRATDIEANTCRIEDPTAELYRGRLLWTTGFFAQTQDIFVTFDDGGEVAEVYVPGIVEGRRRRDGVMATHLSIAANANDPMRPARVSGCLGSVPVSLCAEADGGFGECIGALADSGLFDEAAFLSNFELIGRGMGTPVLLRQPQGGVQALGGPTSSSVWGAAGQVPLGFGGGGSGSRNRAGRGTQQVATTMLERLPSTPAPLGQGQGTSTNNQTTSLPIIPLPMTGLLLLTGVATLFSARFLRGH